MCACGWVRVGECVCQESQFVWLSEAILVFKYLMSLPLKKEQVIQDLHS